MISILKCTGKIDIRCTQTLNIDFLNLIAIRLTEAASPGLVRIDIIAVNITALNLAVLIHTQR